MHQRTVWMQAIAVSCVLGTGLGLIQGLWAAPIAPVNRLRPSRLFAQPTPPEDPGAPSGRRQGGAGRGGPESRGCSWSAPTVPIGAAQSPCPLNQYLVALVPQSLVQGRERPLVWGYTSATHPTFWFFMPASLQSGEIAEFVLQDRAHHFIHKVKLPLSSRGIIRVSIPATQPSLMVNQGYTWTLRMLPDPAPNAAQRPPSRVFVKGTIYRRDLDPNLQRQLTIASRRERVTLYAQAGLWHDALTELAQLRRERPQDVNLPQRWSRLLQQVDLADLATEPISDCCVSDLTSDLGAGSMPTVSPN